MVDELFICCACLSLFSRCLCRAVCQLFLLHSSFLISHFCVFRFSCLVLVQSLNQSSLLFMRIALVKKKKASGGRGVSEPMIFCSLWSFRSLSMLTLSVFLVCSRFFSSFLSLGCVRSVSECVWVGG